MRYTTREIKFPWVLIPFFYYFASEDKKSYKYSTLPFVEIDGVKYSVGDYYILSFSKDEIRINPNLKGINSVTARIKEIYVTFDQDSMKPIYKIVCAFTNHITGNYEESPISYKNLIPYKSV